MSIRLFDEASEDLNVARTMACYYDDLRMQSTVYTTTEGLRIEHTYFRRDDEGVFKTADGRRWTVWDNEAYRLFRTGGGKLAEYAL